jgi:hypothetical protein
VTVLTDEDTSGDVAAQRDDIEVIPSPRWRAPATRTVVSVVAGLFILIYLVVALVRLRYPFELEWIEGGMVNHVEQVRTGLPLYGAPSVSFTPNIYTPLYYIVAAAVSVFTGTGFVALRLVSIAASIALLLALAKLAHRETNDPLAAVVAAGLFAACYRISGAWLDIAREDTLCLALLFWGLVVARDARTWRRGVVAGLLVTLAFFTKQVALLPAIAVVPFLLVARRGRAPVIAYAATIAGGIGVTSVILDRITQGWFGFYIWTLPQEHQVASNSYVGFFTDDLVKPLAIAMVVGVVGLVAMRRRRSAGFAFHLIVGAALIGAAYSARLHTGGYDNVLLPAYAEIAVLFAIGLHRLLQLPTRTWLAVLAAVLCLVQFGRLAYNPVAQLPSRADVDLGNQTIAALRQLPQPVYMPGHPWYLAEIGQPTSAHASAIGDVLRAGGTEGQALANELWQAVAEHRYASIVVESATGYTYLPDNLCRYYEAAHPLLASGEVLNPITGTMTGPGEVWLPRDVPSDHDCNAVGQWTVGRNGETQ